VRRTKLYLASVIGLAAALAGCGYQPSEREIEETINEQIAGISCVHIKWPPSVRSVRPTSVSGPYRLLKLAVNDSNMVQDMYRTGILQIESEGGAYVTFRLAPEFMRYFRDDRFDPPPSMFLREQLHVCGLGESVTEIANITVYEEGDLPSASVEFKWDMVEPVPANWTFFPELAGVSSGWGRAMLDKPGDYWEVRSIDSVTDSPAG